MSHTLTTMSDGSRPPAIPGLPAPSEYVSSATGYPSGLTDRERALLLQLAVLHFADLGEVVTRGDQQDVYLEVADAVHIHAARDWVRWAAFQTERQGDLN